MNRYYEQKVTAVEPLGDYGLRVTFKDGFTGYVAFIARVEMRDAMVVWPHGDLDSIEAVDVVEESNVWVAWPGSVHRTGGVTRRRGLLVGLSFFAGR